MDDFYEKTGLTKEVLVAAVKGWAIIIAVGVVSFKAGKRSEARNH